MVGAENKGEQIKFLGLGVKKGDCMGVYITHRQCFEREFVGVDITHRRCSVQLDRQAPGCEGVRREVACVPAAVAWRAAPASGHYMALAGPDTKDATQCLITYRV